MIEKSVYMFINVCSFRSPEGSLALVEIAPEKVQAIVRCSNILNVFGPDGIAFAGVKADVVYLYKQISDPNRKFFIEGEWEDKSHETLEEIDFILHCRDSLNLANSQTVMERIMLINKEQFVLELMSTGELLQSQPINISELIQWKKNPGRPSILKQFLKLFVK